jgi:predicted TPR repeat methyltransferase
LDEAVAQYQCALALKPGLAEAHNNLGNAFKDQGKLNKAIACYRSAFALKPDFAEAHNNLGTLLTDQGKLDEAVVQYQSALALKPNYAEAHLNLGTALQGLGHVADAEASYRRALEIDPEDTLGARLLLASLGLERMPMRASEAYLNKLYIKRSHSWDSEQTYYFGHQLVAEALKKLPHKSKKLDILDAGCGTGLVGALVRDSANKLDGVDISSAMLVKAREKKIYDHTYQDDLLSFMLGNFNCYDAITCAATLIHFGDLTPVFHAAASCLRDDGLFVFSLFANDSEHNNQEVIVSQNSSLAMGGCFAHSAAYVSRLAEDADFSVDILESRIHEYQKNIIPIMGLVVALRRRLVVS